MSEWVRLDSWKRKQKTTESVTWLCLLKENPFSTEYKKLKRVQIAKHTCHLQQHFFNISEPNKGTKGSENHSLDWIFSIYLGSFKVISND
jgi:hypothetical protein